MNKNLAQSVLFIFALFLGASFAQQANAAIVINEIYGAGGASGATYNRDYVELYNNGATSVNISGYSLQYATSTGTNFTRCNITAADTIIEPGTYFLIQLGTTDTAVGGAIPTPDSTPTCNVNIAASVGKLALVSGTTTLDGSICPPTGATIVDFVGYGTGTNCFEGTAPATAPANNQSSIQRTPIGTDTNNNASDFTSISPPMPRNSNSPTAAMVNVAGRVMNSVGRGIIRALVRLTDGEGNTRFTYTNTFGYYRFNEVQAGETVVFEVRAKRYNFAQPTQVVSLTEATINVNFTAY